MCSGTVEAVFPCWTARREGHEDWVRIGAISHWMFVDVDAFDRDGAHFLYVWLEYDRAVRVFHLCQIVLGWIVHHCAPR